MAKPMNKVLLLGTVGKVQTFTTKTKADFVRVRLATDNRTGPPDWHNLKFFGKVGTIAKDYLKPGMQILIEGSLHYDHREYDGRKWIEAYIWVDFNNIITAPTGVTLDVPEDNDTWTPAEDETFSPEMAEEE